MLGCVQGVIKSYVELAGLEMTENSQRRATRQVVGRGDANKGEDRVSRSKDRDGVRVTHLSEHCWNLCLRDRDKKEKGRR